MDPHLVELVGGGERMGRNGPIPLSLEILVERRALKIERLKQLGAKRAPDEIEALARSGQIFEEVVLEWLAEQQLFADIRRRVYFRYWDAAGRELSSVREIDGLVNGNFTPPRLIETVVSVQGVYRYWNKRGQLLETLPILRRAVPEVQPLMVFIAVGPEPVATFPSEICTDLTLNVAALQSYRLASLEPRLPYCNYLVPCVVIPMKKIFEFANSRGWNLHPSLVTLAEQFAQARYARRKREDRPTGFTMR